MSLRQLAIAALALLAYAFASHWLMVHAGHEPWAVAALLAPMLGLAAWVALKLRHRAALLACGVAALVLATIVARGGLGGVEPLYVLQHVALHAALGAGFGLTLRAGATPLISAMAARVQGPLDEGLRRYTRRLTTIWVVYFFGMALLSTLLYALGPWWWWSLYANVLTPLAAAALFLGEFALRYRLHPEFERVTLVQTVMAWRNTPLAPPPQGR
ncbi:MAG: hypothetical protein U1E90_16860 [Burkholderiaceae bacterium]